MKKYFFCHSCSTQHFALNDNGEESKAASHPSENSLHDEVLKQRMCMSFMWVQEKPLHMTFNIE